MAALLASHGLGTGGERIKRSLSNKLSRSLLQIAGQPASISSFNLSYSDAGLFGFHIIANKNDVGKVIFLESFIVLTKKTNLKE